MDQERKIPLEAVNLYTQFIHGEISRRSFMSGLKKFSATGLTAAALAEALMPNYALGQVIRKDDERIKAEYVTVPSPDGNGSIRGYLVRPASTTTRDEALHKLPGVIVVHENRGLNPHTEDVARRFALANFIAFAPDALTSVGGYPGDDYKGGQLFSKLDMKKTMQDWLAAARWLKAHPECTGQLCATGFCYGGGVANTLAVMMGSDLAAAAPFYGAPTPSAQVSMIKAAILVHQGALDPMLGPRYEGQIADLKKNNIRYEGHLWPGSVHGFFNDATPERYNRVTAPQAWARTLDWFDQYARSA